MSELTTFRDHARAMSTAEHKDDCWGPPVCVFANIKPRASCEWNCADGCSNKTRHTPDPACSGCVTDADRALWGHLADEVDAYLGVTIEEVGLFG